jgi:hypothetical protein
MIFCSVLRFVVGRFCIFEISVVIIKRAGHFLSVFTSLINECLRITHKKDTKRISSPLQLNPAIAPRTPRRVHRNSHSPRPNCNYVYYGLGKNRPVMAELKSVITNLTVKSLQNREFYL